MKIIRIIGLISLFCFTFMYTEKIINVTMQQDEIMIQIKEYGYSHNINPINATIENDTIIPGNIGKYIDAEASYKAMKKIGYFNKSLLVYKDIYPEISIYNNYNKYIIKGNIKEKKVSLIYVLNNVKTLNNILNTINNHNITINFFIDSNLLNNNINIINELKNNEIYNYGNKGLYTKDNLIISNNIINNKSNNKSTYCLFIEKNTKSLNNCANNKMLSIIPTIKGDYLTIKNNLENGSIIIINNTQELNNSIEYITNKGYKIVPLSNLIIE